MDRIFVYPGAIPLDTDALNIQRNVMVALGYLVKDVIGSATVFGGLATVPTSPASLGVNVGAGSIYQLSTVDATAFGSLAADTADALMKVGINTAVTNIALTAPSTSGQSINYLIEASLVEADGTPVTFPYYNASNPAQSWSGPTNSGTAQNTVRTQRVQLQAKAGTAATTGTQTTPAPDSGWVGLAVVTVAYGATTVVSGNISTYSNAPLIPFSLPSLRPGFGSGVQSFASSGTFTVPAGVTQVEVEVWGGGSGSYASVSGTPSGGGSGGGYSRKRVSGLTPGSTVTVTVGAGGTAGTSGVAPGAGGTSSFGAYASASGGGLNVLNTTSAPPFGAPGGVGSGGDVNVSGSDGGNGGSMNTGGLGGGSPCGGGMRSVAQSVANTGYAPGGGASGAGTGAGGTTANPGAAGGGGLVIVRY
jgi:hypothetical protein